MNDSQYDGTILDVKAESEKLCEAEFELMPHQNFVKNFMSFNTPYNSLLLYHGLGSGKTCSAIGISEEMRKFMKQLGQKKSIIIVASPNVQDNFKTQLFNPDKMVESGGLWSMNTCVGNDLLREVNPTTSKDLKKERIVKEIKALIQQSYSFMGYTQFSNFISNNTTVMIPGLTAKQKKTLRAKKIKSVFSNRMLIIDEVHNLRITGDNNEANVRSAEILMEMVQNADNLKLLLLSATPMYNSYEEIIWLTNLMSLNDKKSVIKRSDVFAKNGEYKSGGKELLIRKLTGYVSYVRGENPYTFPVRIYAKKDDYLDYEFNPPTYQINDKKIKDPIKYVPVFYNSIGAHQKEVYYLLMRNMDKLMGDLFETLNKDAMLFENMDSFGYTLLQRPLEILNIAYPTEDFEDAKMDNIGNLSGIIQNMVGKAGLSKIMTYKEERLEGETTEGNIKVRTQFDYKSSKYGKLFSRKELQKYSAKMSNICDIISKSEGIILVYSQYIDGGIVPMALALEEMGFARYSSHKKMKSLLANPGEPVDYASMMPRSAHKGAFTQAKYVMITGDKNYSRTNEADVRFLNSDDNKDGRKIKVVLISKAAAEGIDFKNIRQIHIMDPWYNMNRIEQIIGRGVRNLSHCALPFEKRNVEIFLHATNLDIKNEAVDTYIYRVAEKKSVKIGKITRLLKENSIDCLLNIGQNNFTSNLLMSYASNENIEFILPNGMKKSIVIGDKPYTDICDYMENCQYTCPNDEEYDPDNIVSSTYNDTFIVTNNATISKKIKELFMDIPGKHRGKFFLTRKEIIDAISGIKSYPLIQINYALNSLIESENEFLLDEYGRVGRLVNKGVFYYFQPVEITNTSASLYERETPVDVKMPYIDVELPIEFKEVSEQVSEILESILQDFNQAFNDTQSTSWYHHFSTMRKELENRYHINEETQRKYVMFHILDSIKFSSKIELMNYIYNKRSLSKEEEYVKEYFDEKIVISDKNHDTYGILLSEDGKNVQVFMLIDGKWVKPEFTETRELLSSKTNLKNIISKSRFNNVIGFFEFNKSSDTYVFKIRTLSDSVNKKGIRVMTIQNKDLITKLNEILGRDAYTLDKFAKDFLAAKKDIRTKLSILIEVLLRNYQETNHDNKVWFLTDEQFIMNQISKYKKID